MKIWKAHFRDKYHDTDINITNTEGDYKSDPLSFTLDGITFAGTSPGDLQPVTETDIGAAAGRFNILKAGGFGVAGRDVPYWYMLQGYALDADIPVTVVRRSDGSEVQGIIHLSYELTGHDPEKVQTICLCDGEQVNPDDVTVNEFSLTVDGKKFSSTKKTLWFETALLDISEQMSQEYSLKCCFTCQYSDYSPYGSDDFGTLQCFIRQKENYLKVNSKSDYFNYLNDDWDYRQETYLCGGFEPRNRCEGYRGFV